jgi:hypothetical protein
VAREAAVSLLPRIVMGLVLEGEVGQGSLTLKVSKVANGSTFPIVSPNARISPAKCRSSVRSSALSFFLSAVTGFSNSAVVRNRTETGCLNGSPRFFSATFAYGATRASQCFG